MSRRHGIAMGILVAGVGLMGCTTVDTAAQKRSLYVDEHPELSEVMAEAILAEQIQLGMTMEMVEVAWGKPSRMEKVSGDQTGNKWVYGNFFVGRTITNLYFDVDGVLTRYEVEDQLAASKNSSADPPRTSVEGTTSQPSDMTKGPGGNPPN